MITEADIAKAFTDPVEYQYSPWRPHDYGERPPTLSEIQERLMVSLSQAEPTPHPSDAERHERAVEAAQWAKDRLHRFALAAQRGEHDAGGRELERQVWAAFSDFDAAMGPPADVQEPVAVKALMAKLADLLDEDQFADCEEIVRKAGIEHPTASIGGLDSNVNGAAEALARMVWGYFKGDGTGGTSAMQWFENNKSLGGPAHVISLCRSALSTSQSDPAPEIAALRADNERLRGALATIIERNQEREFMGDDASDGYGNQGWVVRDGQYARIASAAVAPEQEEAK